MSTYPATMQPKSSTLAAWIRQHPLTAYFILAFAGSWIVIMPLVLGQDGSGLLPYRLPDVLYLLIYVFAAYTGPALAAFVVTGVISGRAGIGRLLRRFVQWRVGFHWYLIALFGFLLIWLVGYTVVTGPALLTAFFEQWPLILSVFLPNLLLGIFVPSLGEEPGWRGFALPRLQQQSGPLGGSLILGALHGLWHLPVLFTPFLGPFTPVGFVTFVLTAIGGTFVYTWVFNNTRGSLLIMFLLHAASNAASQLLTEVSDSVNFSGWVSTLIDQGWLNVIIFGVTALLLVALTRGRLGYRPEEAPDPGRT